jgi:hypothetical protein
MREIQIFAGFGINGPRSIRLYDSIEIDMDAPL